MRVTANSEMARAWDGDEGDRWTEHADRYDAASRRHWGLLVNEELVGDADRVLDIGCGTGKSTREAARLAPDGSVLGVDLSSRMLALAAERAAADGLRNVTFEQADAQVHPFGDGAFDVAISSFGAMFFEDRRAAFANIGRALRPGGRLALLAWRELGRNEWLTALRHALADGRDLPEPPMGAPGPFGLADAGPAGDVLAEAGFDDVRFTEVSEPVELGRDADDAFGFVRTFGIVHGLTDGLDDATRQRLLANVHRTLEEHETPDGVAFGASAWLVTARRR